MNHDIEKLKEGLEDYLNMKYGIYKVQSNFSCIFGTHTDRHPSAHFYKNSNTVYCFSCGERKNIFDFIAEENHLNVKEDFSKILDLTSNVLGYNPIRTENLNKTSFREINNDKNKKEEQENEPIINQDDYFYWCHKDVNRTDYWHKRGITDEVIERYNLGYDPILERVIIPTSSTSYVARAVSNVKEPKVLKSRGKSSLFNTEALNQNEPVFIVEGEIDALSILTTGKQALGLGGIGNLEKLIELLRSYQIKSENIPLLILFLDNDVAGQDTQKRLAQELDKLGLAYTSDYRVKDSCKDANDMLLEDVNAFRKEVSSIVDDVGYLYNRKGLNFYFIDKFINTIKSDKKICLSTGFNKLNECLDGGFRAGLYILGAVSSQGKTTFASQVVDFMAQEAHNVLIFSLEMSREQLMAKSISRKTLEISKNVEKSLTAVQILEYAKRKDSFSGDQINNFKKALDEYRNLSKHIFTFEGIGDIGVKQIRNEINRFCKFKHPEKPMVLIDYLQILAPYDYKITDKANMDKAVIELKRISRDYDIPIIAISSFNRSSYGKEADMNSFKESGGIEYTSDVLLALQTKGVGDIENISDISKKRSNDFKTPREMELKILKNRSGKVGDILNFEYFPAFNFFEIPV